jgi:cold shock CspA family protein
MQTSAPRFSGKLTKWNADRGFGFVVADHGDQELFVHVTAFPRDGQMPVVGEPLTFEMERDAQGRKRAIRVGRPGAAPVARATHAPATTRTPPRRTHTRSESSGFGTLVVAALLVAGLAGYGYHHYSQRKAAMQSLSQNPVTATEMVVPQSVPTRPAFNCDGRRHCSQMTSCSEAKRFLENCPGMEMDGDNDGIPCEQQLCTGPSGG